MGGCCPSSTRTTRAGLSILPRRYSTCGGAENQLQKHYSTHTIVGMRVLVLLCKYVCRVVFITF